GASRRSHHLPAEGASERGAGGARASASMRTSLRSAAPPGRAPASAATRAVARTTFFIAITPRGPETRTARVAARQLGRSSQPLESLELIGEPGALPGLCSVPEHKPGAPATGGAIPALALR